MLLLLNKIAVFLGTLGTLLILVGMLTYVVSKGRDPGVLKPEWGILSHVNVIRGLSLLLLCWVLKFLVHFLDPSIPIYGPEFMWFRMTGGSEFYDDSFMNR